MDDQNYVPFGAEPAFVPDEPIAEMTPSFSAYFNAQAGEALREGITGSLARILGYERALSGTYFDYSGNRVALEPERKLISAETAKARAEDAGVSVDFGTGQTTEEAAELLIARARSRAVRQMTIASYKPGIGTSLSVSLLASMADPLNVGAAFIPFVGQARYGAWLAEAGGFGARSAIRAGVGAVEGFAGTALFEPFSAIAATQEGRDYELSDAIRNIMLGGVIGAGFHVGAGAVAEKLFKRSVSAEPVQTPLDVVARLPEEAREVGLRTAIADLVDGRPVAAAEAIDLLARDSQGIADAISYASTLRRDGPAIDDTEERIAWWTARLTPATTEKPVDLLTFLRGVGGVRDTTGEIKGVLGNEKPPTGTFVSKNGAKRTGRGMDFERAFELAQAEGYVADRAEFLAAFQPGSKPVLRASDAASLRVRAGEAEHTARMLAEAGVSTKTRNEFKARAIVGREQALIAAERARYSAAQQRIENRLLPEPAPKPEPLAEPGADPLEVAEKAQDRSAFKRAETDKPPTEAETLKAETMRRFEAITKHLPPEDVVRINDELARIDAETADLVRVADAAVACLLGN